jgi:hypothetical protein
MLYTTNEILNVAAKLEKRCEAARAIAANALPGLDRLYWSKVAQDYAAMAGILRATVELHHPEPLGAGLMARCAKPIRSRPPARAGGLFLANPDAGRL